MFKSTIIVFCVRKECTLWIWHFVYETFRGGCANVLIVCACIPCVWPCLHTVFFAAPATVVIARHDVQWLHVRCCAIPRALCACVCKRHALWPCPMVYNARSRRYIIIQLLLNSAPIVFLLVQKGRAMVWAVRLQTIFTIDMIPFKTNLMCTPIVALRRTNTQNNGQQTNTQAAHNRAATFIVWWGSISM